MPELPKGQTKIDPGKPWAGVPQLDGAADAVGDLCAPLRTPAATAATGTPRYRFMTAAGRRPSRRSRAATAWSPTA